MPLSFDDIINKQSSNTPVPSSLTFDDILQEQREENVAELPKKYSTLKFIKEHPFKAIFQPVSKTLGKSTAREVLEKRMTQITDRDAAKTGKTNYGWDFLSHFASGTVGSVTDIAQTPASWAPDVIGKMASKIPIGATTIGRIATTTPIGKGFFKGVSELQKYETALANLPARVATSRAPIEGGDAVYKVINALKGAGPVRAQQAAVTSAARSAQAGKIKAIGETNYGEQGFVKQLGALKGELPKAQFSGIRNQLTQPDIDSLFNTVERNQILRPFDKVSAKNGLAKLLGQEGVTVPTSSELNLLKQVFPEELVTTALKKLPLSTKVGQGLAEVLNIPRAIRASFDMSAPFRQGVFLLAKHPIKSAKAFGSMFKYFFSQKSYEGLMDDIANRPTYGLMKQGRLSLTDMSHSLTAREEAFMSDLAGKIPKIGPIIKASNRAYSGFLNKLRADVFDGLLIGAKKQGVQITDKFITDLGGFISTATGRGGLGAAEKFAVALNTTLFSPRLMASRLSLMNPQYYAKLDPFVRKEALKSLFAFVGTGMTVLGLAKMGGAEIGVDPRSADFGKIKIRNTRYDIWGGFQQYIRAGAQLVTGEMVSSTTGVKTNVGEGYKPITRLDLMQRFIEGKLAPVTAFVRDLLKGRSFIGKTLDPADELGNLFMPMVIQDIIDLAVEEGPSGILMSSPAIFGTGVQTYKPTASGVVFSMKSAMNQSKELYRQGRTEEAQKLLQRNKQLILIGKELEPLQKTMDKYRKVQKEIKNNVLIPSSIKKEKVALADKRIKAIEEIMDNKYLELLKKYAILTNK